jgi:hypothetical protein
MATQTIFSGSTIVMIPIILRIIEHENGDRLLLKVYLDENVFKGMCAS